MTQSPNTFDRGPTPAESDPNRENSAEAPEQRQSESSSRRREILELPDRIHQARVAALQTQQRHASARNHYQRLLAQHYERLCVRGDSHYRATHAAALVPDVILAREASDETELHMKYANAEHKRLTDRLSVLLRLT